MREIRKMMKPGAPSKQRGSLRSILMAIAQGKITGNININGAIITPGRAREMLMDEAIQPLGKANPDKRPSKKKRRRMKNAQKS